MLKSYSSLQVLDNINGFLFFLANPAVVVFTQISLFKNELTDQMDLNILFI